MIRRMVSTATVAGALAIGLISPAPASATAAGSAGALYPKVFTWNNGLRAGDCTMFQGAKWTLYPNGTATFDATVTSGDNNDAWLMWVNIQDENKAVLGRLVNNNIQDPADRSKFVMNLPDRTQRYRWFASGWFNPAKFNLIKSLRMDKHC
ncbi:DUF6294 family protein [Streptosporangium sp. NPDC051023]|uniref:DUF6294 family protein n=1 Tax=Streptosporangium sp. NPDC051023 TaxID=3155410 RepID=UPI00344F2B04